MATSSATRSQKVFDLDYSVESNEVKQNLILREVPVLPEAAEYFGLSEGLRMPAGYALFSGETMLGEELFKTQEDLQIRHIETGELLVEIPAPMIMEAGAEEPYMGTFFVQVYGPEILLITVVESDWLLDEDRVYPVAIDPSIRVNSAAGGYWLHLLRLLLQQRLPLPLPILRFLLLRAMAQVHLHFLQRSA